MGSAISTPRVRSLTHSNVRGLKSAKVTTCCLTALISIRERMSGIIENLLGRQMKVK
jgi:hypothetical protein